MCNKADDNNILISVLLPVFKADVEYLKEAVNSILAQTYKNWEMLILYEPSVDDEEVFHYIRSIADDRIRVVDMPKRAGLPASLNEGIRQSRGQYLARMDSDDVSEPNRFEIQLEYMEKHKDVAVVGSMVRILGTDKYNFINIYPNPQVRAVRMMFFNAGICHPTAFFRKEYLQVHNLWYNEKIRGCEDYHLWGDIVLCGGIIQSLNVTTLNYRVHAGQATEVMSKPGVEWNNQVKRKLLCQYGEFTQDEQEILESWYYGDLKGTASERYSLIQKMIEGNQRQGYFDVREFHNEMTFQWIYKALLQGKNCHDLSMFRWKYLGNLFGNGCFLYVVRNLLKVKSGSKRIRDKVK